MVRFSSALRKLRGYGDSLHRARRIDPSKQDAMPAKASEPEPRGNDAPVQPPPEHTAAAPNPPANPGERPIGEIYLEYAPLLRRVAVRKFDIPLAETDSLVRDVFFGFLVDPRRDRTNPRGYLIAAMCNACRRYWSSRNPELHSFPPGASIVDNEVSDEVFEGLDQTLLVATALARLPPRYRDILRRHYLEGQDTKTIADALGTTPTNLHYLLQVCRIRAHHIYSELKPGAVTRNPTADPPSPSSSKVHT
jgi:RNA polymerase sigma factor (sigma-70 family)